MQIAAMNPAFLDKADVSQDTLDKEKEIQLAMMANDPKMAAKPLNFSGGKGCIGLFNIAEATLSPKCRLSKGLKGAGARIFSSGIIFPPS